MDEWKEGCVAGQVTCGGCGGVVSGGGCCCGVLLYFLKAMFVHS